MVKENLRQILNDIRECEKKSGRKPQEVRLLAVSKFHPAQAVIEAVDEGQLFFGENRVLEAYQKFVPIIQQNNDVCLHIIGSLQTNKVKKAVEVASVIESLDRLSLLLEIEKQCAKIHRKVQVYFEIHTGEESKSGFKSKQELIEVMDYIKAGNTPHVIPKGFMTMAPLTDDQNLIRQSFRTLRLLKDEMQEKYAEFSLTELSMGMSGDYQLAIEEGSTQVRIGTAIFGHRDYSK